MSNVIVVKINNFVINDDDVSFNEFVFNIFRISHLNQITRKIYLKKNALLNQSLN